MRNHSVIVADIFHAIVDMYLEDGKDHTVAEIAARAEVSEATVRKHLNAGIGGMRSAEESRQTFSRNYPAFEHGAVRVRLYGPTREYLRNMVIESRRQMAARLITEQAS